MIFFIFYFQDTIDLRYFIEKALETNKFMLEEIEYSVSGVQSEYPFFYLLPLPYFQISSDLEGENIYILSLPIIEPSFIFFFPLNRVNRDLKGKSKEYAKFYLKKEFTFKFYEFLYYYELSALEDSILKIYEEILKMKEEGYKSGKIKYEDYLEILEVNLKEKYNYIVAINELKRTKSIINEILKDSINLIPLDSFTLITLQYDSVIGDIIIDINKSKIDKINVYKWNSIFSFLPSLQFQMKSDFKTLEREFRLSASINISQIIANLNYFNIQKKILEIERKQNDYEKKILSEKINSIFNKYNEYKKRNYEIGIIYENLYKKCENDYYNGILSYENLLNTRLKLLGIKKEILESEYSIIKECLR